MDDNQKSEQIEKLKRRLPNSLIPDEEAMLSDIFDDCMSIALAKSNRNEPNEALLVIVRDASLSIWNKRGDEGMNSSSAGGQSFIYEDISQKIQDEIIRANLRLFRL